MQTLDAVDYLCNGAEFSGHALENIQFGQSDDWELVREQMVTITVELLMVCSEIRRIRKSEREILAAIKEEAAQRHELSKNFERSMISVCEQVYLSHANTGDVTRRLTSVEDIIYELGLSSTTSNQIEDLSSEVEELAANVRVLQSSTAAEDCSALHNQLMDLISKYETDASKCVVATSGPRQDLQNMTGYSGAFIDDIHDETCSKFPAVQFTEDNDFELQCVPPAESLTECRQEHDDVSVFSWENTKKIASQKIEGKAVVCGGEMDTSRDLPATDGRRSRKSIVRWNHIESSASKIRSIRKSEGEFLAALKEEAAQLHKLT